MANLDLDRSMPPLAAPLEKVIFPKVRRATLSNGVEVHLLQFGTQEIVELSAVFPAGKSFETAPSVSTFTTKMLHEGTTRLSSLEFARLMDWYGAFVHVESGYESASLGLTSLAKHLESTVPLWVEMMVDPAFPGDEFEKLRERTLQHLDVEMQNTGFIARREFNRLMYGESHPYGAFSDKPDIEAIRLEQLKAFHQSHFHPANAVVVAVGRFDEDALLRLLDAHLGQHKLAKPEDRISLMGATHDWPEIERVPGLHYFEKADSMQATLRVGHRGFARRHPDYYPMQVVNTVLGGYFGSRLMKNIREDKGYTYGIASAWLCMKFDGTFVIQTDVGNEYIMSTLEEMKKEIRLLMDRGVNAAELDLVRNYMLGRSATGRETPNQMLGLIQSALVNEYPLEEMDRKFDIVMAMRPEDVQRLAQQYLHPEKLIEVVCGKME